MTKELRDLIWQLDYTKKRSTALMNRAETLPNGRLKDDLETRAKNWQIRADETLKKIKELEEELEEGEKD